VTNHQIEYDQHRRRRAATRRHDRCGPTAESGISGAPKTCRSSPDGYRSSTSSSSTMLLLWRRSVRRRLDDADESMGQHFTKVAYIPSLAKLYICRLRHRPEALNPATLQSSGPRPRSTDTIWVGSTRRRRRSPRCPQPTRAARLAATRSRSPDQLFRVTSGGWEARKVQQPPSLFRKRRGDRTSPSSTRCTERRGAAAGTGYVNGRGAHPNGRSATLTDGSLPSVRPRSR